MAFGRIMSVIRSPILVASIQAGGMMCVGDVLSQKVIEKRENLDLIRVARFGTIGFFMVGPVLRGWYGLLERKIVLKSPGASAFAKMLADQCLMAPIFLANFIAINSYLQGNSWTVVQKDVSSTYTDILLSNYQLWPAVQTINFFFVPLQFRVLFVQTVAIAWNAYLSWKTNQVQSLKTEHKKTSS